MSVGAVLLTMAPILLSSLPDFFFFFFSFSPFGFVLGEIAAFGGFDDVPRSCT